MSRTEREQTALRVPSPRLEPEPWFVQRLSELAAASTPSRTGLMASRAGRATVIAVASAALVTGGAYAADRVTGSSLLPGDHAPSPVQVPTDRATPTPSDAPEQTAPTDGPTRPAAPGGTATERTVPGPSGEDGTEGSRPGSEGPRDRSDDPSDDTSDHSDPSDDSSSGSDPDPGSDSGSDEATPTSTPSSSPSSDADRESPVVQEAPTPDALEEN